MLASKASRFRFAPGNCHYESVLFSCSTALFKVGAWKFSSSDLSGTDQYTVIYNTAHNEYAIFSLQVIHAQNTSISVHFD